MGITMRSLIGLIVVLGLINVISTNETSLEQDYDELKNEAESEVFDTWLNNLPKVLLWKLKYLANRNNLVKKLEDAATVTENNKRSDYDRYRRGSYKELRRYG